MPGVLVDDQFDPMSQAFLRESFSSPVSCGSTHSFPHPFHPQPPSYPHQARSPIGHCSPPLSRSFPVNSGDRELSHALSQLSPLFHHRGLAHPSANATDGLNFLGGYPRDSVKLSVLGAMDGCSAEEFSVDHSASDQGLNSNGFGTPKSGEMMFGGVPAMDRGSSEAQFCSMNGGGKVGNLYSGNEVEEQGLGSPYSSSGASLWSQPGGGAIVGSPTLPDAMLALHKFLPSNLEDEEAWPAVDVYSCDEFRMFEFKVRRCMRGRSHDWTECPFAHPGEKARRRDPRRFHYSGTACPDFRKGNCKRGDACEFAHGVFECWLHPARYRTQPCKDGRNCKRRVCFFAHTPEQLRLLPAAAQAANASVRTASSSSPMKSALAQKLAQCASYDGSPLRCAMGGFVDGSQIIDASSPPGYRESLDGSSFNRFGGFCNNGARGGSSLSAGYLGASFHHGAHSAHPSVPSQVSSPTSTLIGHSLSPPSLSPPLSPSMSPPGSPVDWSSSLAKSLSCLAVSLPGTPSSPLAVNGNLSQGGIAQLQPSYGQSIHSLPNQAGAPAHRRHLDRLNSLPSLSIPVDHGRSHSTLGSPTSASTHSSNQMADLIALLKQVEMTGPESYWLQAQAAQAANMVQPRFSSGPSPLRRSSQSVPGTPTKPGWKSADADLWGLNEKDAEPSLERVESGRGLRAKIFESLVKGNQQGSVDDPDVGWVNELVKEDSR